MAEAAIGAGLSIGEASVGALIDLKLSVDGLCDHISKLRQFYLDKEKEYEFRGPTQLQIIGNGTSDAAGDNFTIDLGGPAFGRRWELRQLVVGGATWSTVVAGTAELYTGSSVGAASRSLASLSDRAAALPSNAFYGGGQVTLRHPERLFVVIVSPTAATQYTCNGAGFDMPDAPALRTFGE